jgi:hypothetical protein
MIEYDTSEWMLRMDGENLKYEQWMEMEMEVEVKVKVKEFFTSSCGGQRTHELGSLKC